MTALFRQKKLINKMDLWIILSLLSLFFLSHFWQIQGFPPFLDESIGIFWGERITQTGPLAYANEGRILTNWLMILFQAYDGASIWIARTAVLFVSMLGFSAALGIARILAGRAGLVGLGLLLVFSPYHFFYQRLALPDTTSGSILLVSLYFTARLYKRENLLDAVLAALAFTLAVGFKISAIIYLCIPFIAFISLNRKAWRWLISWLGTTFLLLGTYFSVLIWRDYAPFALFFSHNRNGSGARFIQNLSTNAVLFSETTAVYWTIPVFALAIIGILYLCWRKQFFLPLALLAPLGATLLNLRQSARYWFVPETMLAIVLIVAFSQLPERFRRGTYLLGLGGLCLWIGGFALGFIEPFYSDAKTVQLPKLDYMEYVVSDASGYGIAEIVAEIPDDAEKVIGILSNCYSLRYLAPSHLEIVCPRLGIDGQDIEVISQLVDESQGQGVYAILEDSPYAPAEIRGTYLSSVERPSNRINLHLYRLDVLP